MSAVTTETPNSLGVPPRRSSPSRRSRWSRRLPLLPALLFTVVVTQIPFLLTLWYSFHEWTFNKKGTFRWNGGRNFSKPFKDPFFRSAVWHTVVSTVGTVIIASLLGLFLATLLDRSFFGQGFVRTLLITPFLVMPVVASLIWRYGFLDAIYGFFNWITRLFGAKPTAFTSKHPMASMITVLVWQWTPFMMLILLSGLQSQTSEVLEAARVDGANGWQTFRSITIPHLRPYLELGALLGSIYLLQSYETVTVLVARAPDAQNVPYFIYQKARGGWQFGQASAYGVVVVIATLLIANVSMRLISSLLESEH
jgi:sorbitol/mannitol transport system permease protein